MLHLIFKSNILLDRYPNMISTLFKDIRTQIKLNGYLCFEYPHTIIVVLDILFEKIHDIDI